MRTAEIGVVVATHNGSATLERAIRSVASQHPEPELVVVDDGSDREHREIAQHLAERYRATMICRPEASGGPAAPRNEGARALPTRLLVFLDDDDELAPGAVSAFLATEPAAVVLGDVLIREEGDAPVLASEYLGTPVVPADFLTRNHRPVHGVCLQREWFERLGGFNERLRAVEDWHLWIRVVHHGGSFRIIENVVGTYHCRPPGASYWRSPRRPLVGPSAVVEMFELLSGEFPEAQLSAVTRNHRRNLGWARIHWSGRLGWREASRQLVRGYVEAGPSLAAARGVAGALRRRVVSPTSR